MYFTAQELAELIVKAENSDSDGRLLARRIRHLEVERLICAAKEKRDARGTAQFDEVEVCKARLLSVLMDFGFDKRLLSQVAYMMAPPPSYTQISNEKASFKWAHSDDENRHIKNLPNAVRRGESWELTLNLTSQFGRKSVSGGFHIQDPSIRTQPDVAENVALTQEFRRFQEIEHYGTLVLPVLKLCAPIISSIDFALAESES